MNGVNRFLVVALVFVSVAVAAAHELDALRIESWTGAGLNQVVVVIDFWPYDGDGDSFAFGYRFDGASVTGLAVLEALHDADNGLTFAHSAGFVTDFWYVTADQTYHTGYAWPDSYWSYWWSADFGQTWEYAMGGAGDRVMIDGDTDGWLGQPGDDWDSVPVTPLQLVGDLNCDGLVDLHDINPFVLALSSPAAYALAYPLCAHVNADVNGDGVVDVGDINPFVVLLAAP